MSEVKLDTRELDRIAKGLDGKVEDAVRLVAFSIERDAKIAAPYLTGALEGSIYTRTRKGSTHPKKFPGHVYVEIPAPTGKVLAVVGSGIEYAAYVEFGHLQRPMKVGVQGPLRFIAAKPYLGPAVEQNARKLNSGEMWRELFT